MIGNALKLIQWLYSQDKEQLFEIKKHSEKRNKKQNSKYWKLLFEISLATKVGIEEIHFDMLKNYSTRYEALIPAEAKIRGIEYYEKKSRIRSENGKEFDVYHIYTPSHELNKREFAILLKGVCQECRQLGIETLSPDEIKELEMIIEGND